MQAVTIDDVKAADNLAADHAHNARVCERDLGWRDSWSARALEKSSAENARKVREAYNAQTVVRNDH